MDNDIYKRYDREYGQEYNENYTKINTEYNTYFLEFLFFLFFFGPISYQIYMICFHNLKENNNLKEIILIQDSEDECSICLEKFKEKEKKIILKCSHEFHKKCIKKWLNNNNTCPLCRIEL